METRQLGSSEITVSVVGIGCNNFGWRIDEGASRAVVDAAIDAGVTLFDTAESYDDGASERFLGAALSGHRDRVVIATKFGWGRGPADHEIARGSRSYVHAALEASLERLSTDYVDLFQYHRPDGVTPIAETLGALDELVRDGKVRAIGSSNLSPSQVREADAVSHERGYARFISAQNNYNLLERDAEQELIPACEELRIGFIPYFPLAKGLLTGKYHRNAPVPEGTRLSGRLDIPPEGWDQIEALEGFAATQGVELLDVAISGLLTQPAVSSVITGATTAAQVRANVAAGAWRPSRDVIAQLRALG